MADNDLHFFTADGKETTEGALDSVVQYTEADATARGLKFKPSDYKAPEPIPMDELMALAALDGSEPAPAVEPVKVPAEPEKAEPEPGRRPAKK